MSTPSLDLFWPRDVVGRTIGEHPIEAAAFGGGVYCRGCAMPVRDASQHVMRELLAAVERLRSDPPAAPLSDFEPAGGERDRRESQIVWDKPGGTP